MTLFKKRDFHRLRLVLLLGTGLLSGAASSSCTKETTDAAPLAVAPPTPAAPETHLLGSTLIGEYSPAQLASHLGSIPVAGVLARYPIRVYKLTYATRNTDGQTITASGALLLPLGAGAAPGLPLISYQHGTIRPDEEGRAPSYYKASSEVYSAVSILAATGYVVAAPDYIGYGASKSLPHPYEHAASLASASLDMLRAAREFCAKEKVALNQQNFLLGYSEGGYATMALHKLIEEKFPTELTVTASAPGAGAYHKTAFAQYILASKQPLSFLSTYVWVLDTYNRVYNLNRPLSYYFNPPYAARLQADRFSQVPDRAEELFTPAFRSAVLTNSDAALTASLQDNDLHDWRPKAPLALFHGTADDYVPYFNSEDAYQAMRARGATQVSLHPIEGGNHFTSITQYTLEALAFISQY